MANLQGTTVTGDLAVTGATSGQGAVPIGAVLPVVTALTGSHTIPNTGTVDADGWQYCDGAVIPGSQTLSGTTPNLTDGRFLRGFTTSSGCGGSATFTLAEGNLAAHNHGGATTSASTTPGVTGARSGCASGGCGQTSASTTPGVTGARASCATGGCGQTSASTTPGATGACGQTTAAASGATSGGCGQTTSACAATTGGCGQTTSTFSANHTHAFSSGGQSNQHCHCVCQAGGHLHRSSTEGGTYRISVGGGLNGGGYSSSFHCTDTRNHCVQHSCCVYNGCGHSHSGTSGNVNANHTHTTPSHSHSMPNHSHTTPSHTHSMGSHTHTTPSHSHTSVAHTHTTPSHTHTMGSHTHDSAAHTHTTPSHTHTMGSHTHDSTAHTHSTTIASAGSGTAKEHLPIYFNVKYLIRVH